MSGTYTAFELGFETISGIPIPPELEEKLYELAPTFTHNPDTRKERMKLLGKNKIERN